MILTLKSSMDWTNLIPPELKLQLDEILASSRSDFTAHSGERLNENELAAILRKAEQTLHTELELKPAKTSQELAQAWNRVVRDFYENNRWSKTSPPKTKNHQPSSPAPPPASQKEFLSYLKAFLIPTFILKTGILYCGLMYSEFPGLGYGWGLAVAVGLSVCNLGLFLWTTRHTSEDENQEEHKS